jgi:hypothetical protein
MTMHMTQRTLSGLAVACVLGIGVPAVTLAAASDDEKKMTLTGCLVKGEGDGGYLLTNSPSVAVLRNHDARVEPGVVGTAGVEPVFYWLFGDHDLKDHVGHQIEVQGDIKGDVKSGEIKLDRKARWTEMTVKADGRTMKADVPNAFMYPDRDDQKGRILVRRIDVDHVRMVRASCDQ